jgi:imidazolonepropionase-like amidohydrolase
MKKGTPNSRMPAAGIAAALLACVTPAALAATTLIENVTLIDGTGAAPLPAASVLIKGDRIDLVSPVPLRHATGARIIDGTGKFLIPGLFDAHIHLQGGRILKDGKVATDRALGLRALHGYLYSGVTSVYDSGNNPDFIFALRDDERAGRIVSPRIFATGSAVAFPGGYGSGPFSISFTEWEAGKPLLEAYLPRKPDVLKLLLESAPAGAEPGSRHPGFSTETLRSIVRFANAHGVRTTIHVSLESDAWKALDAGVDDMAHLVRLTASEDYVTYVATKHVPMCTTLTVLAYFAKLIDDPSFLDAPLFKATVDPQLLAEQKTAERQRYIANGVAEDFRRTNPQTWRNTKRLFDQGAILALGTDRTWGPAVHMELELLHEAGIPLFDLVKIATLNAAIYLGKDKDLGSIERGKLADLLLLRADPTKDVANFQAIDAVFKGGERVDLTALDLPVNRR